MTIIQTNKYLIFSGDELTVELKREWVWHNFRESGQVRRNQEEGPPQTHYREVAMPYSQYASQKEQQEYVEWLEKGKGRQPTAQEIQELIIQNLWHVFGDRMDGTNRWGEKKVTMVNGANPFDNNAWQLWFDDHKQEEEVRRGDKHTYRMKPALTQITRQVVEDDDDDYPLETYHFDRDVLPDDLHLKPNLYLVCDKQYLKRTFDSPAGFMGLTTKDDGKEVIRAVNDYATVQQIVAQNEITAGQVNNINAINDYNLKVRTYNQQIRAKITDFQDRITALNIDADFQQALLISIEKENLPEVATQINLIFQARELMQEKEELRGDGGDPARQTNNQAIETRNTQLIKEWENDFIKKRAAVEELKNIYNRFNPNTSGDNSKPNDSGQQKPNDFENQGTPPPPQRKHSMIP